MMTPEAAWHDSLLHVHLDLYLSLPKAMALPLGSYFCSIAPLRGTVPGVQEGANYGGMTGQIEILKSYYKSEGWIIVMYIIVCEMGFPGGSDGKESACSAGDLGSISGLGRSPVEGNDNPLQYSCLENPMDRGAWQATVHGIAKSQTTERLTLSACEIKGGIK